MTSPGKPEPRTYINCRHKSSLPVEYVTSLETRTAPIDTSGAARVEITRAELSQNVRYGQAVRSRATPADRRRARPLCGGHATRSHPWWESWRVMFGYVPPRGGHRRQYRQRCPTHENLAPPTGLKRRPRVARRRRGDGGRWQRSAGVALLPDGAGLDESPEASIVRAPLAWGTPGRDRCGSWCVLAGPHERAGASAVRPCPRPGPACPRGCQSRGLADLDAVRPPTRGARRYRRSPPDDPQGPEEGVQPAPASQPRPRTPPDQVLVLTPA